MPMSSPELAAVPLGLILGGTRAAVAFISGEGHLLEGGIALVMI